MRRSLHLTLGIYIKIIAKIVQLSFFSVEKMHYTQNIEANLLYA